jgi:hypothetical protein
MLIANGLKKAIGGAYHPHSITKNSWQLFKKAANYP